MTQVSFLLICEESLSKGKLMNERTVPLRARLGSDKYPFGWKSFSQWSSVVPFASICKYTTLYKFYHFRRIARRQNECTNSKRYLIRNRWPPLNA